MAPDAEDRSASATTRSDGDVPVLTARPGGSAERFARHLAGRHPAAVFVASLVAGFAVLVALSIAVGLLVTEVLVPTAGIGSTDERISRSLVTEPTGFLADASAVGSFVGGGVLLPIIVLVVAIVFAALRRWRVAAFAVVALLIETSTYGITSQAISRERPHVNRLEDLPADASYPSGHTAAAIAVYAGLALLLTSRVQHRGLRVAAWLLAVLIPAFVAMSRLVRGMHHPLDVAGGVVVGVGAVVVLVFGCRAAGVAAEAYRRRPAHSGSIRRMTAAG